MVKYRKGDLFMKKYKNIKLEIDDIIYFLLVLLISSPLLLEGVRCLTVKNNVENNNIIETTCAYELTEIKRWSTLSYEFLLENGDEVWIPGDLLQNEDIIENYEELYFAYVPPEGGIESSFTCFEITSEDGSVVFVDQNSSMDEINLGPAVFFILGMLLPLLYIFFICLKLGVHL